jgi:periplasmic protein CpxP/Spy
MKKISISLLLAIALLACGTALYAQDSMSQGQAAAAPQDHHPMMSPDQRLQHMTRQYNLTEDQQTKIKPILEQEQQQMQTLRSDTSMSQQDRMSKIRELRQSTNEQIKGVLTPDQQKKWEAMQNRRMEGGMSHGSMGQGQPTPQ